MDAATSLLLLAVVVGISCAAGALNVSNALVTFSDVVVVVASDVVVVVVVSNAVGAASREVVAVAVGAACREEDAVGAACREEVAVGAASREVDAVGAVSRNVAVAVVVVVKAAQKFSSVLFRLVAEAMPREAKQSQCPADLPTAGGSTKLGTRVTGEESRQSK